MFRRLAPLLLLACLLAGGAHADPRRGELIAMGGKGPQTACFTCHGLGGAGQAASGTPALAGLDAAYLRRQLDDYASGARPDGAMTPIAKGLTQAERAAVAHYYATLPRGPAATAARRDAGLLQEGAAVYAAGRRDLRPCADCHGTAGRGLGAVPALAGQPALYTARQLRHWQHGERNDPGGVMAEIARAMTTREIAAVAAYLESLAALGTASH